jgi:hypothetical protein
VFRVAQDQEHQREVRWMWGLWEGRTLAALRDLEFSPYGSVHAAIRKRMIRYSVLEGRL